MYRLQKLLSMIGLYSRRSAERLIVDGRITLNGKIANLGDKWEPGDTLRVDNKELNVDISAIESNFDIIKYYKPVGEIVSTKDKYNDNNVFKYLPHVEGKWISIGRLDVQTSGLILFTNNGDLANELMHPSKGLEREYIVTTNKLIDDNNQKKLLKGVLIDENQMGKFKKITKISKNKYYVVLVTGKNREVRKSLKALDIKTLQLHRCRYGTCKLGNMKPKDVRFLSKKDILNLSV